MQPASETNTTTEATAALDRLKAEREKAMEEAARLREDLDTLETTTGDRLLTARLDGDADAAARIRAELQAARDTLADAEKVVNAADRAIIEAGKVVHLAEAMELRAEAGRLFDEAEPRLKTTAKMLDALHDHEAVSVIPGPWKHPSGAAATGSWQRSKTGEILASIIELETRAAHLERHVGQPSPPSILAGIPDVAWHIGNPGTIEQAAPIAVHGSQLDDASAVLMGKLPTDRPTPDRGEIARQYVAPWRMT
jgi:hypothetical protein